MSRKFASSSTSREPGSVAAQPTGDQAGHARGRAGSGTGPRVIRTRRCWLASPTTGGAARSSVRRVAAWDSSPVGCRAIRYRVELDAGCALTACSDPVPPTSTLPPVRCRWHVMALTFRTSCTPGGPAGSRGKVQAMTRCARRSAPDCSRCPRPGRGVVINTTPTRSPPQMRSNWRRWRWPCRLTMTCAAGTGVGGHGRPLVGAGERFAARADGRRPGWRPNTGGLMKRLRCMVGVLPVESWSGSWLGWLASQVARAAQLFIAVAEGMHA